MNVLSFLLARALLFLTGLAMLWWALRGRRVNDHPICRRCGYDLWSNPGAVTCLGCGADLVIR